MAALITEIIGEQGFEKVRDAIAVILLEELTHQKAEQNFSENIEIFSERIVPMSEEENLYINVLLDSATYGNFNERDSQGRTTYFIDVYTTGKSGVESGSLDSAKRLHKFIGMVRYILSSTIYKTLNLPLGLIGGTYVENFATVDPDRAEDGSFTRFGRLTFTVRIQENQELWQGVTLVGSGTRVKLAETDKGYRYEFTIAA